MGSRRTGSPGKRPYIAYKCHRCWNGDAEEPGLAWYYSYPISRCPLTVVLLQGAKRLTRNPIGIGRFTIIDDALVTEEDLGANFFLDDNSVGLSRAEKACELLRELNPDVNGDFIKGVCWGSIPGLIVNLLTGP